jgi:hypothetical protein
MFAIMRVFANIDRNEERGKNLKRAVKQRRNNVTVPFIAKVPF